LTKTSLRRGRGPAAPGHPRTTTARHGRPNQGTAHDLVVAPGTVTKHVTHILGKLGAANRTEAAARAGKLA
jgi:DNA-binding NarL/FixJ family response regulator